MCWAMKVAVCVSLYNCPFSDEPSDETETSFQMELKSNYFAKDSGNMKC